MALITADWNPLGKNVFYRKFELYSMEWLDRVELSDFVVAAAPFGGPIALWRDENKIQKVHMSGKPTIFIFSSSGQQLSTLKWNSGRLKFISWSSSEELLCVQDDGNILIYDIFANYQRLVSMGQEAKDLKILECKIFHNNQLTGIAVLTTSYRIFVVNNINDPKIRRMAEIPGLETAPSSWAVITQGNQTSVLVAKEAELYLLDHSERCCQQVMPKFSSPINAVTEIAVSYNSKYLALCTDGGTIWLGTTDLQVYCEYETKCPSRPKQLVWCGTGAVVGYWDNMILVIGPEKDWMTYSFDSAIHLVPDIDSLRIVSNTCQELLQKVPAVVCDIFRIGSMAPGAILLEASKEFQKKSHKADEYICLIREQSDRGLEIAVEQCIMAAGHEFQPSTQKMLLRAASFGKSFVPEFNAKKFTEMCQTLRVLNAVREYTLGIPMTFVQFKHLSLPVLLDRLILRRQYCLAIRICEYLKIPNTEGTSRILAHWACYKVKQTHIDEEQIAREIADKLGYTPGISYAEIAHKAAECGRKQLAITLLDYESKASEQVPLLMKLKQDGPAMMKAISSGDTDLIFMVILHLRETMQKGEFEMAIRNFPVAYALHQKYCKDQNIKLLQNLYHQEDDFLGEALCHVTEYCQATRTDLQKTSLHATLDCYKKSKNEFLANLTEDQLKLLKYQQELETKFRIPFMNLSLHQTIYTLILSKQYKLAEELKKEFKVTDRKFWWIKISTLAEIGEWLELDRFAKSKKSPIGYEPFVDICMKHNNKFEAQKYLSRVRDENRIKYCLKVGQLEDACKFAFEQKDEAALSFIQSKCGVANRMLAEKIAVMKAQLARK